MLEQEGSQIKMYLDDKYYNTFRLKNVISIYRVMLTLHICI